MYKQYSRGQAYSFGDEVCSITDCLRALPLGLGFRGLVGPPGGEGVGAGGELHSLRKADMQTKNKENREGRGKGGRGNMKGTL